MNVFSIFLFFFFFFFFNDTATTEIYTLSLHDALPISSGAAGPARLTNLPTPQSELIGREAPLRDVTNLVVAHRLVTLTGDRKSTRLNSSHGYISYAVFCLKKKKKNSTPSRYIRS